jgi:phosphoribosylamine--glycine ligase
VCPVPDVPDDLADELIERFHRPVLAELARRGLPFRGALYAGLLLTADGPRLLEFNARLGDPETQVILPRLAAPLGALMLAAARGRLGEARRALGLAGHRLPVLPGAAVGIVLAAEGYPGTPVEGVAIEGLDAVPAGALVFHSGTDRDIDGTWRVRGGRVLTVVGQGPDVVAARAAADAVADRITWPGQQRRHDIASAPVASGAAR